MHICMEERDDCDMLRRSLHDLGRVQIPNFLRPGHAKAAYQELASRSTWDTFFISSGRQYLATAAVKEKYTDAEFDEIFRHLHLSARNGELTCIYDIPTEGTEAARSETGMSQLLSFLGSIEFSNFLNGIFDRDLGNQIDLQVQCHRSGYFTTYHRGRCPPNSKEGGGAIFCYNLTPEWIADWGGMLTFRNTDGASVVSHAPNFNSLDLFSCPYGHWVTPISPFASGPKFVVAGYVT